MKKKIKEELDPKVEKRFEKQKKKWEEKGYDLLWEDLKEFLAKEIKLAEKRVRREMVKKLLLKQEDVIFRMDDTKDKAVAVSWIKWILKDLEQ